MLEIELGRLKHDLGYCLPLNMESACDPAAYGYDDMPLEGPLALRGQAENAAGEIQVTGRLTAHLKLSCSRCGMLFPLQITLPFQEIYSSQDVEPDAEGEQDKHPYSGGTIDLTPEALRVLFAELPMKPLCKEDCRGLCPVCGADLNHEQCSCGGSATDPRWDKLKDLLKDDSGKGV